MPKASLSIAAPLLLLIGNAGRAENWPQWRGTHRDGAWSESGILESFPPGGLTILWRAPVELGWSSPVVAQGRVYLTDSYLRKPKTQERVLCFDEATGKPLWAYTYDVRYPDWAFTPGNEARLAATPIAEAGKLYALGGNGHVHCLDAIKGTLLWSAGLEERYVIPQLSCRASPLIEGRLLVVCAGGKPGACVVALDKSSGKEVWKALDEPVSNSSPIVITAGGKKQLIVWTGESVTSLAPLTGQVYWQHRLVTSNNDAIPTPVFHGDLLLIGGLMLKLDPQKPAASILWPDTLAVSRRILSNTSTALLQGDYVFSARSFGQLVCLDAKTGKQVWTTDKVTDLKNGASIHLAPNGDAVFLYTEKGDLIRAKLSGRGYQEISRARLLEPTYPFAGRKVAWAPPSYANRCVFARSDKELVCASLAAKP
jgi:outer membrane protein assembly factor BamB